MAKKSFIDRGNPAMQFISAPRQELPEKEESSSGRSADKKSRQTKKEKAPVREQQEAQEAKAAQAAQSARSVRQTAGEKSAAAESAAADNVSAREQTETSVRPHPVAPRRQGESKSKRVQLLVPPSLHMRVSKRAAEMELSFNEYVNQLLEKSIDGN